jgi:hypothetical protein
MKKGNYSVNGKKELAFVMGKWNWEKRHRWVWEEGIDNKLRERKVSFESESVKTEEW